jgi:hypothetical protein
MGDVARLDRSLIRMETRTHTKILECGHFRAEGDGTIITRRQVLGKQIIYEDARADPIGRRRSYGTFRFLGLRVQIPRRTWMFVSLCFLCLVLVAASATSGSLVRSNHTPHVCLIVCDTEISTMRRPDRESGCSGAGKIEDAKSNELAGNVVPYALA